MYYRERLVEAFKMAEAAGGITADQVGYLVGLLPKETKREYTNLHAALKECPTILSVSKEVKEVILPLALLSISRYRDREDIVGRCADLLIREHT